MSQEKVDRYKKEKANRKEIMKKEKRKRVLSAAAVFAVIAVLAVWWCVSVFQSGKTVETVTHTANYTAIDDYLTQISA